MTARKRVSIYCDDPECELDGDHMEWGSDNVSTIAEANRLLIEGGWVVRGDKHICPDCLDRTEPAHITLRAKHDTN